MLSFLPGEKHTTSCHADMSVGCNLCFIPCAGCLCRKIMGRYCRIMNQVLAEKVKKATKKKSKSKRDRSTPRLRTNSPKKDKTDGIEKVKIDSSTGAVEKKRSKSKPKTNLTSAKKDSSQEQDDKKATKSNLEPKASAIPSNENKAGTVSRSVPDGISTVDDQSDNQAKEEKRPAHSKATKKTAARPTRDQDVHVKKTGDNKHNSDNTPIKESIADVVDSKGAKKDAEYKVVSKSQKSPRLSPREREAKGGKAPKQSLTSQDSSVPAEPPLVSSAIPGQSPKTFKNRKSIFEQNDSDVPSWAKRPNDRSKSPKPGTGAREKAKGDVTSSHVDSNSPTPARSKLKVGKVGIPAASTRSPGNRSDSNSPTPSKPKVGKTNKLAGKMVKNPVDDGMDASDAGPSKRPSPTKRGAWSKSPKDITSPVSGQESRQSKMDIPLPNIMQSLGVGSPSKRAPPRTSVNQVNWSKSPRDLSDSPNTGKPTKQWQMEVPVPNLDQDSKDMEARSSARNSVQIIRPSISQTAATKVALEALLSPPVTKKLTVADLPDATPRKLKRGFVALNIASPQPTKPSVKVTPPKRSMDRSSHGQDKATAFMDSALMLLEDKKKGGELEDLVERLEALGGFPKTRRLSMRDNELVGRLVHAIRNRPAIKDVHVEAAAFRTISAFLLSEFIDSLRLNLHVKSLSFSGVELGNDFLYALGASLESNLVVEEIDLSQNCFTNEGLAAFCQDLATSNQTVKRLNLKNQTTPISIASEVDVLEAFRQNTTLTDVKLDFLSDDGPAKLTEIMERNKLKKKAHVPLDDRLIGLLKYEVERAQELFDEKDEEEKALDIEDDDWPYLYELAVSFDKHKLKKMVQDNAVDAFVPATQRKNADDLTKEEKKDFLFGEFAKTMEESVSCFNSDGSFLTAEFIAKHFKEIPEEDSLEFDFHGQWKLFKRFPIHDPARATIVKKFVDAIVTHPRASELTHINMANTGCGDDFLTELSERCLKDDSLLPRLHALNFETNFINEAGVRSLSKLIADPNCCKYMQVIRLENQKGLLKSKGEFSLAKALRVNRSIVVVSLRMRNLLERQQIAKYVVRNVDFLRQARQRHMKATGTQRKRNKVEQFFDSVRDNDKSITKVNMVGNERFLTLTNEEKVKAASSLAKNKHVTEVILNGCRIDDEFAMSLGKALKTNTAVEKINLESNDISGDGIKALFEGLGENQSVRELRLHKQSKVIATADEHILADLLENNKTITKLGIDLRSTMVQVQLDRKTKQNKNLELKEKAKAKGDNYVSHDSFTFVKF